jgi:FimV-like protein
LSKHILPDAKILKAIQGCILLVVIFLLSLEVGLAVPAQQQHKYKKEKEAINKLALALKKAHASNSQLQLQNKQLQKQYILLHQQQQQLTEQEIQLVTEKQALQAENLEQNNIIKQLRLQLSAKDQQHTQMLANQHASIILQLGDYLNRSQFLNKLIRFSKLRNLQIILYVTAIILLLILLLGRFFPGGKFLLPTKTLVAKKKDQSTIVNANKSSSKEPNYRCLAGEDIVTAKLDLARVYCDMGDKVSAKNILTSVLQEGNEKQQQTAKKLLAKMKSRLHSEI